MELRYTEGCAAAELRSRYFQSDEDHSDRLSREKARYFGLQQSGNLGYFVGVGRLPEIPDCIVRVLARRFNNATFSIDYAQVYAICAADTGVSRHLNGCLTVYSDEAPVEVEDDGSWSPIIALAYLKALHNLIHRHLRSSFVPQEEVLRGRMRGRIDMPRYAMSRMRGHAELVPCRFQALDNDTRENRILRAALIGARKLLDAATGAGLRDRNSAWRTWARQSEAALSGVSIARVAPKDFHVARKAGAFRHYAQPLALARAVLTRVGFDPTCPPQLDAAQRRVRLVPFRLATAELFERYVEVCLRHALDLSTDKLGVGRNPGDEGRTVKPDFNNLGTEFRIRPDFLVQSGEMRVIVDAKYKDCSIQQPGETSSENPFRHDSFQVLAYSLHHDVQNWCDGPPRPYNGTVLCYPVARRKADARFDPRDSDELNGLIKNLADSAAQLAAAPADAAADNPSKIFHDFTIPIVKLGLAVPIAAPRPAA